ncbi:uncharacterized protein F54H12.2-like [Ptychodera flava]|uniref:uncharacterized protein F54H12.2-like n=1 Tax=Ptychodera flava TaxID=63121 RepID=UPI00396AA47A
MAFLHEHSCECTKSELDLFTVPPTQTSVEEGQWEEVHPLTHIVESGPIEFVISGSGEDYIDLSSTLLLIKAKITKVDGTNLGADAAVGPVNLWLHSLFSQVDVHLNGKMISNPSPTYPYRAMLETLLNYGKEAKETHIGSALFFKDFHLKMDEVDPTKEGGEVNKGLKNRYAFTSGSKVVDMVGPIHSDLFFQPKYLMNGVELRLKLNRSKNAFSLVSSAENPGFKAVVTEATLLIRKIKLSPSVQLGHAEALKQGPSKYPIHRCVMKVLSIPGGTMSFNKDHIFLGQLPKRVVLGLVDNDAFNGSYKKNPFNFKHYDMTSLVLNVSGKQVPSKPLKLDFTQAGGQSFIMAYYSLFTGTDKIGRDEGININHYEYDNGYTLFAFDLTSDLSADGGHLNLVKEGNLGIELQFRQALPNTVNLLVYGELDNIIEIDRDRNVLFDY